MRPEIVPSLPWPENEPSCAAAGWKLGARSPGTLGCGTVQLNWPFAIVTIGWPGVWHQEASMAPAAADDVMRIMVRYEPSNAVMGGATGSVCIVPIELAQPATISIRAIGHTLTWGMAAILYLVARLEHMLIFWFPLTLAL
jgi:hypothetical protein